MRETDNAENKVCDFKEPRWLVCAFLMINHKSERIHLFYTLGA